MSFDWGGFAGEIIGTLGALGAVKYSFCLQEKKDRPQTDKQRVELIRAIYSHIQRFWYETHETEFHSFYEAYQNTIIFINSLNNYLNVAIGTDRKLVITLLNTIDELNKISNQYSKKDRSKETLWDYTTDNLNMLISKESEIKQIKNDLFTRYKGI